MDTPMKQEVQITSLKMGRYLSNAWMKTIGKSETDLCTECQMLETIDHILTQWKKCNISKVLNEKYLEKKIDFTTKMFISRSIQFNYEN